jgi:putative acetyltransferase
VRALIGELQRVLSAEYPPEQRHGLTLEAIFEPHIRFFLARLNGNAIGCGGVALFADFAEVKRMYVREAARGRGVAQALLKRLETEARDAGLSALRLETGDRQYAGDASLWARRVYAMRRVWSVRGDAAGRRRNQHLLREIARVLECAASIRNRHNVRHREEPARAGVSNDEGCLTASQWRGPPRPRGRGEPRHCSHCAVALVLRLARFRGRLRMRAA